ncbi:MAG: helix-turn-helix domain-containing protein [Clostridia bacterium]|nr:helix-turn-helix domain-containing protein [Clostridia bacterium]
MKDIKEIFAKNLTELRTENKMTQLELAEKLNYTDKAVSKWERGESVPDVTVLISISELFGVTLDYLFKEDHTLDERFYGKRKMGRYSHGIITALAVLAVWFVTVLSFVVIELMGGTVIPTWLLFIYALPVSGIVWLVFNSIWFNRKRNYFIISLLMWSGLLSLHLSFLTFGMNIWRVYLVGIPAQLIITLWSVVKKRPKDKSEKLFKKHKQD